MFNSFGSAEFDLKMNGHKAFRHSKDGDHSFAAALWPACIALLLLAAACFGFSAPAFAEGSVHAGLNQPFVETNASAPGAASTRDIIVDIRAVGEVINISACGAADTNVLAFVIETPTGTILPTYTPTAAAGKISCTNAMTAPITTPYRYTTTQTGKFKVRLINVTSANFSRFDVTVTANSTVNPDPTGATGIIGRVSSVQWNFSTGAFTQASSTDANYYVLAPGGAPTENYVWQLDLNDLAGNAYGISANNKGVNAPRSGFSTDITGNAAVAQFNVYLNYPAIANPPPSAPPAVTGFRFVDAAGQDFGISPGVTPGAQDTGTFEFTTNVSNATYAIAIDANKNGIFGDAGDVTLSGNAINGFNSIPWNGTNNAGTILPLGTYQARAEVRLGEFHFIANDVETSGGTSNGITVYEATSPTTIAPTQVYWDDITILGIAAGGTSNTPLGATSGTAAGYHTWGTFDTAGGGFGNSRFVDTYAFGRKTQASLFVAIVGVDTPMTGINGVVTITPTSRPGDALALSVTDGDLNSLSTIVETILVSVVNNATGETEAVTLTETGVNTGIFTANLPTSFGTVLEANNNGTLITQASNTLTVTYNDALTSTGGAAVRSAADNVTGGVAGSVSITALSIPGDTLAISVTDADLNTSAATVQTITVQAINTATGEIETVTLTETGPNTGVFSGGLVTAAGAAAGANNSGSMNSAAGNIITVTYTDGLAANGGPANVSASDTVTTFNPIVAANDTVTGIINAPGGIANVLNVLSNDLVNGSAADISNAVLTLASGSTVPSQLAFDPATGNVSVNAGATAATYSFTYQICEAANPVNCRTAVASVTVADPIATIVLTPDSASDVNGTAGAVNAVNVFTGDTINGLAATSANAILSVAAGSTVPAGLTFDPATGNVSVAAGTAAGSYSFDYQLCEAANITNCQTASVTITVAAISTSVLVASPDSVTGVNGASGAADVVNAFAGDTVNGVAATSANAILSVASGSTVPAGLSFDTATGNVSVASGTAAGVYSFDYQLCEALNPANCATSTITVTVVASPVVAAADTVADINGASGAANVVNAFAGDMVNGAAATSTNAILSVASGSAVPTGLTFDVATGNVSVASGTPAGVYSFNYQLCEALNPTNCATSVVSVTVVASPVVAAADTVANINGASGAADVVNAFAGDTVNGAVATSTNAILSVAAGSAVPASLSFDTATGNVSVAAGTSAGVYSFNYQLCEALNPTNCATSVVSVTVVASPVVAAADTVANINGASGAANVVNAFAGDTVNGAAATSANAILSVAAGSTVPAALTFDLATGNVSVVSGTAAGVYSFDYQLCEALNPSNCKTSTISVTVAASALSLTPLTIADVNGASGLPSAGNAFAGNTVNGAAATSANAILSIAAGSTVPTGLTFDLATGNLSVAAGTPAGVYSFDYQLCEALNPANCATSTITVTVAASALVTAPDSVSNINGASGAANVVNAFAGDTVNGAAATSTNAILSVASGSAVPAGLTFDLATGNVSVAAGTAAGVYSFSYQLCEALNPANCATSVVSVTVVASPVVAAADSVADVNGASGAANVLNAFTGDTVNGAAATSANAILSVAAGSNVPASLTFDVATGNVSVAAGTPAGVYSFDYQLCEALNPANCKTSTISVTVAASALSLTPLTIADVNGASGAANVVNAFAGDTVNGAAATSTNAILSVASGSAVPTGLTFDLATGNVSVAAGTAAGVYSFDYQLCEALNPANCVTSTISVTVAASALVTAPDTVSNINGASGAADVVNAFTGDTVNGAAATSANAILSVAAGSTVPAGLSFDTATGNVSVAAGTPAGVYSFDYQLCETLNPANCATSTITVTVAASALSLTPLTIADVNGASGAANVVNAFAGNTVNGAAATSANAVLSVATGSAVPAGLTFDLATGNVSVAAGTAAGVYSFSYQLCEALNPANCATSTISVTVAASALVTAPDSATGVNGASGAADVVNAFAGDTVNGAAATSANAILSVAAGSAVPAGLTFDVATGNVSVAAGTAAGVYSFDYQLCETLNPTNCKTSTVSVTVAASALSLTPLTIADVNGASGLPSAGNAFAGNTVNGAAATSANAILSVAVGSAVSAGLTFDLATGNVSVAAGTPAGVYSFNYQLCEVLNPTNCATSTISVTVAASALSLTPLTIADVNGASGVSNVVNAFAENTVNGAAATSANALLSVASGSTVPAGLTFDLATGNVSVAAGTAAGVYSFNYQLCEALNPANCATSTISVTVAASALVTAPDSVSNINGASGAVNVVNAFAGDTVNGGAATSANAILSVASGSAVPAGLTFDLATGNVSVAAGTPAGVYSFDYQLCEALNPSNCTTSTITVTVAASALSLTPLTIADVNGASGAADVANAFAGNTVNGVAATSANAILSVASGSAVPTGLAFDLATGNVSVAAGTPAGVYSFDYQLCEALNPANCATSTISVTVEASALSLTPLTIADINGASGAADLVNAFAGDTVNGVAATSANALLSVASGSTVPAGLTFDLATGNVSVAAGTPAGVYSFNYQLCEALNPANCATSTITVTVAASALVTAPDSVTDINGASGAANVVNVFASDTVNGAAATSANAVLSVVTGSTVPTGLTFDLATGNVSVAAGTPAGVYSFDYQLCEVLNPTNCKTSTVSVTVEASALSLTPLTIADVNGASGLPSAGNAFAGNMVNGGAATSANAILSVAVGSAVPAGLTFDVATGNVSVAAGTPAGVYSFNYQLCEALNPANCATSTITVTVAASALSLTPLTIADVNGASGAANVANAFAGNMVNGVAATSANAVLSVATGSAVPTGLTFDAATGNVSVAAGTAAGVYSFNYQLCEALNPANCTTSTISVTVAASALVTAPDSATGVNGASGAANVVNAFAGDTVNGAAATSTNAILSVAVGSTVPAGLTFDVATGNVSVAAGTPAGVYSFDYQLCEALNPANCATSTITVTVAASALSLTPLTIADVNGASGASNVVNAFAGNTVNGAAATSTNALLTVASGSAVPTGLTFDVATGNVSVASGTPAGVYSFNYQLCEALNPANCVTSTITVTVVNPGPQASPDAATVVRGNSVIVNVLANDSEPGGDPLTVRSVSAPAHGNAVINADGTVTYTPEVSYVGPDSFTYTVCDPALQCVTETVSLIVHPSVSALNGVVYLDLNADGVRDNNDQRQPNWIVEIVHNGVVVATTRTDANGFYQVNNLPLGPGYSVVFRHPATSVVYGRTEGVTLTAGVVSIDLDRPIDPSGVIYDSIARTPIEGVRVTMVDGNGVALPGPCFLDASQQGQLTGTDGRYRIDLVPNAAPQCPSRETFYRIVLAGPSDTLPGLSTIILPETGPFDPSGRTGPVSVGDGINAPQGSESTRHYFEFRLGSGDPDVINNHIPLDRAAALAQLVVTKTSAKRTANIGDLVPYTIIVRNPMAVARNRVDIVDTMPAGFQYVANSGRVNAAMQAPAINGRELNWRDLTVPANGSVTISVILTPGAAARDGDHVNVADSRDALSGRVLSNQGQATVRITPSPLFDCSEIIGKVFDDRNGNGYQDDGEIGLAGARVATVNGLLVTADQYGRYHITCAAVPHAQMGSNFILKLDTRSLPSGYRLTTENPRVVRVTRGKMAELDFGVRRLELVTFELNDSAFVAGSHALKPDWEAKIPALLARLRAAPSRLRLHYAAGDLAKDSAAQDRLEKLAAQIAASWKEQGGKPVLDIEWTTGPETGAVLEGIAL